MRDCLRGVDSPEDFFGSGLINHLLSMQLSNNAYLLHGLKQKAATRRGTKIRKAKFMCDDVAFCLIPYQIRDHEYIRVENNVKRFRGTNMITFQVVCTQVVHR